LVAQAKYLRRLQFAQERARLKTEQRPVCPRGAPIAPCPVKIMLATLKDQLERQGIHYDVAHHREAFTAQETAAAQHVPGRQLAKVVMLRTGDDFVMAVLPATHRVNLDRFAAAAGREARLAAEAEFSRLFPECEPGAMPPFGNLWGIPVWVDESLTRDRDIWFNAGSHWEAVHILYEDFARFVQPQVAAFGTQVA
jgi:Ala-tRNA(Pro) deacylase